MQFLLSSALTRALKPAENRSPTGQHRLPSVAKETIHCFAGFP
jgi:hypothetical protein